MKPRLDYQRIAPDAHKAVRGLAHYVETCGVAPRLRYLLELRVSQINGCVFCVDMHSRQAREAGENQQRLDSLPVWRESPFFTRRERAALAWAEAVTLLAGTGVPDGVYAEARREFTEKQLVNLTMVIATMNVWNRFAISFRKQPAPQSGGSDRKSRR